MGAHHLSYGTPRWIATTAAALLFMGCSPGSSPSPAQSGLSTRVQAQVATVAQAVAQASSTDGRSPSEARPPRVQAAAEAGRQPGDSSPTTQPEARLTDLRIRRLVVSQGVEAREPIGAAESFALAEVDRLYAFVEVHNADAAESEIFVTFEPERGPVRGHVRLRVGATPRWRTWAYTRGVRSPGTWTAVVRNGEGELLAKTTFVVESAAPAAVVTPPAEQAAVEHSPKASEQAPAEHAAAG
jgi:hypothetical protein